MESRKKDHITLAYKAQLFEQEVADLFDYEPFHQRVGLGILIEKEFRHNNIGFEALQIISNYGLNILGIRNLYCGILADNKASINLFEKAGFKNVGCRKNWYNDNGNWVDEYLYQKQLVK